jgi:hypothetical protein
MPMKLIHTPINSADFSLFKSLVEKLYPMNSPRFIFGFDPVNTYSMGCYVLQRNDDVVGRFALYNNPSLTYKEKKAATIGSYECIDDVATSYQLLTHAKKIAKDAGFEYLIGPMEGSTWNNYRFTDAISEDVFFMEPYHLPYYPAQFLEFGFEKIASYFSNMADEIVYDPSTLVEMEKAFSAAGMFLRTINLEKLSEDLAKISDFCNEAFEDNFLFTPIPKDDFVEKYIRFKKYFDPDFIFISEDETGKMNGLFFPIKDYCDQSGKRFVLKTMARLKNAPFRGMVEYLGQKTIKKAIEKGFSTAIHAFILEDNVSVEMSRRFGGSAYKTHSLYGLEL